MSGDRWLASPILGVANVREAAEYYRDVLGFEPDPLDGVFAPVPNEPGGVYAIVRRAGMWIHFQIRRPPAPVRTRQDLERDVYVYVSGLDSLHAELIGCGARIFRPPHMAPHGIREMLVEDLNGARLAFGEIVPVND